MSHLKISVVLCTYNPREAYLSRTIEALRGQTLPLDQWEFLLIDNASKIPVAGSYDLSWHPRGEISREEKLGKMNAWSKGMNEAKGEILVFVDDDNVLDPDYLEQTLGIAEQFPFLGAWGASVMPEFETPPPPWMKEHYWRLSVDEVREDIWSNLREGFETKPLGAGMCIRREVGMEYLKWCASHNLGHALDRKGDAITGYGDMNLSFCALDLGLGTGKFSRLHVTHLIPSTRLTLDYLQRQAEGDASSAMMFRALRGLPVKEPRSTFLGTVKGRIYRWVSGRPKETFQIEDAARRGLKTGWEMVCAYRAGTKSTHS
jgi:glycosyltransferase involved in cell wall biosynthesis